MIWNFFVLASLKQHLMWEFPYLGCWCNFCSFNSYYTEDFGWSTTLFWVMLQKLADQIQIYSEVDLYTKVKKNE